MAAPEAIYRPESRVAGILACRIARTACSEVFACWRSLRRLIEPARGLDVAAVALRLFLLGLLLRPIGPWWTRGPLLALSVLGLIDRRSLTAPLFWAAATALLTGRLVADWRLPDNHSYLLAYAALAVCLAAGSAGCSWSSDSASARPLRARPARPTSRRS